MKKLLILPLFLFSFAASAQFSITSVTVYHDSIFILDSLRVQGTSSIAIIDTIRYRNTASDACGTMPFGPVFKGCTTNTIFNFDTTYVFPPQTVFSKRIRFSIAWDTSSACISPSATTYFDTLWWDICTLTSVNEVSLSQNHLQIYPNPVKNKISVETTLEVASYEIYTSIGKLLANQEFSADQINLEALPTGVYFVRFIMINGEVLTKKMVVQKE